MASMREQRQLQGQGPVTTIRLAGETDWEGLSRACRSLVARGVPPEDVDWIVGSDNASSLFAGAAACDAHGMEDGALLKLPAGLVEAARLAICHAQPARFALLHRMVARTAGDRRAWQDLLNPDRIRIERLAADVRREMHKTKAFVRFRPIDEGDGSVRHIAWFEPVHHVLAAVAPFFVRRFAAMRWAILTPRISVAWDGTALVYGPGASRREAPPADAGESLWLAYYRSIFNPARLKVAMMVREMPVRYWANLPEASAISGLIATATERAGGMVATPAIARRRRRGAIDAVPSGAESGCADALPASGGCAGGVPAASPAESLSALAARAAACRDCPIGDHATQVVWGRGDPQAALMLVGEQPGDVEDLRGEPFVGPAGALLREAFAALDWDASSLYLTNAVKHFKYEPRGKRRMHKTPAQQEADVCLQWLEAEVRTIQPRAFVALGATAARSLLGAPVKVTAHAGRWLPRPDGRPVLIALHPAAILRADPAAREAMKAGWIDSLRPASAWLHHEADVEAVE
jgi:DNA polymerase